MSSWRKSQGGDAALHQLCRPQPDGPVIGSYDGEPIADSVHDIDGRRYRFAGIMPRRSEGSFDLAALGAGEWIVEPGLIYRWDGVKEPQSSAAGLDQPWSQTI
jgi:hypothetical protein